MANFRLDLCYDGSRYRRGTGLALYLDGEEVARTPSPSGEVHAVL